MTPPPDITIGIAALSLLACLSPLLTLSYLWQLKEWRWDRLREHLQREGIFRTLFGWTRPLIVALYVAWWIVVAFLERTASNEHSFALLGYFALSVYLTPVLLGLLTVVQFVRHAQRIPKWTQKSLAVTLGAGLLDAATIAVLIWTSSLPLIPFLVLLQPVAIVLSWLAFSPIDRILKHRIIQKATVLRAQRDMMVIGITGSVGKTTTKELLAHLLADRQPLVTPAHVNTEMGVAQWLTKQLQKPQVTDKSAPRILIIEMGAYAKGEIKNLCSIVQPTMGVITYIGSQHLALFGSQQALIDAKSELLEALPETGHAFLNGDCAPCRLMKSRCKCPATIVGTAGHDDLQALAVNVLDTGIGFHVNKTSFDVPIHGAHNVTNVLLAVAVGQHLGMTLPEMKERLKTFAPPKSTFDVRTAHGVLILDDTHNASEASFQAAIEWARVQPESHKVLLTSGIIELGSKDEARIHHELGASAAPIFDEVFFLNPSLAKPFAKGFGKRVTVVGKNTAINRLPPKTLLICVGRMPKSTIDRFVPVS